MFKCAYCGSGMEDGDIFCGECGKRVGELSADVIRLLSALPSRDALHQLVSLYPGTLADEITFGVAAIQVFVSDKQRRAQYLSFYSLGLVEQLRGLKAMDQATFSRLVGILVDDGDLKPAAAEQCVGDWAYAFGLDLNSRQEVPLASHQAGEVLHLSLPKGVGLDMVWCPPGAFLMGSPEGELGRWDDEVQHRVTLTKGFWMAKYELTQEQYKALMGSNPANFKGPKRPVEQVSWDEAMAYCQKLNSKFSSSLPSGYVITLPTEAQWEYACRAGTTSALNSGRELTSAIGFCGNLDQVAWYVGNSGGQTHEVGQKQANAWGLYDMHGNVWEWCSDWYGSYGGDATDPVGPSTGSYRVNRGGSWLHYARLCRSACRYSYTPDFRNGNLGFRPVCAPVQ